MGRRSFLRLTAMGGGALAVAGWPGRADAAGATPASATEARFDQLDGVPLTYWRWTDGTAGRRVERRVFASTAPFHDRLVRWVQDLRFVAEQFGGLTGMNRIVTAGVFVAKPGQHGLGQAFDLDQVRWANGAITPYAHEHASADRVVLRRYLALDAVGRRHFHWVLDGRYNSDHADHVHMDVGGGPILCDRTSRSDTVFVQQVLNAHQQARLPVSGAWDRATQTAFDESCRRLGVAGEPWTDTAAWRYWLLRSASCGFADRPFSSPPSSVPDPLRDLVDDLVAPAQHALTELLGLLGA